MKTTSGSVQKVSKGSGSANNVAANSESAMAGGGASQGVDRSQLDEMIAVAAYFRAEQRGFAPGDELEDWFQAEAEYLYRADPTGKVS